MQAIGWFVRSKSLGVFGAMILIIWITVALLAPQVAKSNPRVNAYAPLEPPSRQHLMGTDVFGRDLFARVVYGSRISIGVGLSTVSVALVFSLLVGISTAFVGGALDLLVQRVVDVVMSFPGLLLALLITAVLGQSLTNVIVAIAIGMTVGGIRMVRGVVLAEKERDYVMSARVAGCSTWRICFRHISPNIMPMAIIGVTGGIGDAILAEAGMSFLGLGVPPPTPTWGMDLSQARPFFASAPWLAFFPGLALASTVLAFNVVGDALRDTLDPRLRRGQAG